MFDINVVRDPRSGAATYEAPLRYGKRPEIKHIFRSDPKNPPKIISLVFAAAVLATVPVLLISVSFTINSLDHTVRSCFFLLKKKTGC